MSDHVSLTVNGGFGYYQLGDVAVPIFSPGVGVRTYIPTGYGGFIWSQQMTTTVFTLSLPGSLAFDFPITLDGPTLHLFPEVRYDPRLDLVSDNRGALAIFSGGMTVMLEL